jgi:hypothetical protein
MNDKDRKDSDPDCGNLCKSFISLTVKYFDDGNQTKNNVLPLV